LSEEVQIPSFNVFILLPLLLATETFMLFLMVWISFAQVWV